MAELLEPSPAAEVASPPRRLPARWRALAASFVALVAGPLLVAGALTAYGNANDHGSAVDARVVSAAELASDYGVRVDLVGVTASGGLVDLRFTVLDKTKAAHLFHDQDALPSLYVESTGRVLESRSGMHHAITLENGARYFLLYSNSGGAVRAGGDVSVVVGDVRLAAVPAQR